MTKLRSITDALVVYSVFAIVFATPFSKSIAEIAMGIAIAAWIVRKAVAKDFSLPHTAVTIPLLIYLVAAVPSLFVSAYPALSVKAFFTKFLKFIMLFFVVVDTFDARRLRQLFVVAFVSVCVITVDGLVQHYLTGIDLLHRYPSFKMRPVTDPEGFFRGFPTACFPFPNDLAAWILLVIFPVACAALFDLAKSRFRYVVGLAACGLFFLFFLTKARAAWGGFACSTVVIALTRKQLWLVILLVLMVAVPFALQMEMSRYIFGMSSFSDRMGMWHTAGEIFKQHSVFGNGLNTFFENYRQMRTDADKGKRGSYAHNCYLQMACDLGIVGLLAFLAIIASFFVSMIRGMRRVKDPLFNSVLLGLTAGILAFLIHSFFDTNLYSLNLATLFWLALGVAQAIVKQCSAAQDANRA